MMHMKISVEDFNGVLLKCKLPKFYIRQIYTIHFEHVNPTEAIQGF